MSSDYKTFCEALQESSKLSYKRINEKLLSREFLSKLFPMGLIENNEFCLGSFRGDPGRSLKLNLRSGKWCDFASTHESDKGVGIVSYLAKMWKCDIAEAAIRGCEHANIQPNKDENEVILPAPETPIEAVLSSGKEQISMELSHTYVDIDNSFIGYCVRFKVSGGKVVLPYSYRMSSISMKGGGWKQKAWGDIYPIYNGQKLFTIDDKGTLVPKTKPVLIVEGEKTCDAAEILFPDYTVISWAGGGKKVHKVHWGPLRGRTVVIWPDNDEPGRTAAHQIAGELGNIGVEEVSIVKTGEFKDRFPDGWDLADWKEGTNLDIYEAVKSAEKISILANLLQRYVYVAELKKFIDTHTFVKLDKEGVNNYHAHLQKKIAETMLESPEFRKVTGITYWPEKPLVVYETTLDKQCVNIWKPHPIERIDCDETELAAATQTFLNHMNFIFPNEEYRNFFLNYLAHNVQHPGRKIRFAPLIQGVQGTGKSYFAELMSLIFGRNYHLISNSEIMGSHNGWIEGKCFITIDEVMTGGRREVTNSLKPIIGDDRININEKFVVGYSIPNRVNFLILTNNREAMVIDEKERRYWVYFSEADPQPEQYYNHLFDDLKVNFNFIYEYLQRHKIENFNPDGRAPRTVYASVISDLTKPKWQSAVDGLIEDQIVPFDKDFFIMKWVERSLEEKRVHVPHIRLLSGYLRDQYGAREVRRANLKTGNVRTPMVWTFSKDESVFNMPPSDFNERMEMISTSINF
jgi:hypothetical protein